MSADFQTAITEYQTRGNTFTTDTKIFGIIQLGWLYLPPDLRRVLDRNDLVISVYKAHPFSRDIRVQLVNAKTGTTFIEHSLVSPSPMISEVAQLIGIRQDVYEFMKDVRRILTDLGQSTDTSSSPELPEQTPQPLEL